MLSKQSLVVFLIICLLFLILFNVDILHVNLGSINEHVLTMVWRHWYVSLNGLVLSKATMQNSSQDDKKDLLVRKKYMSKSFLLCAKLLCYRQARRLCFSFVLWQIYLFYFIFSCSISSQQAHWRNHLQPLSCWVPEQNRQCTGRRQYTNFKHLPFYTWRTIFLSLGLCIHKAKDPAFLAHKYCFHKKYIILKNKSRNTEKYKYHF